MQWLHGIRGFVLYLIAGYFFDRQNLDKARKWMDRSNANDPGFHAHVVATDAILCVLEGRSTEAYQRFSHCLGLIEKVRSPNDEYLTIFCRFWLKALDDRASPSELESMAGEASGLPVDKWLRRRFRFPSRESIQNNVKRSSADDARVVFDF
ncbi:hypothetical protein ACI5KX_13980 [Erythrobacter sp. GH1-10]|uniref:hypothetical protein n=1 Tax=Erythrobacter sp. GH1-10 TaxID=3349334 RepID=UPI00387842A6